MFFFVERLAPYETLQKKKNKEFLANIDSAFDMAIFDVDPNE